MTPRRLPHSKAPLQMATQPSLDLSVPVYPSEDLERLVRSPSFLEWFGDWRTAEATSSAAIGPNGRPLLVYHGTPYAFARFEMERAQERTRTTCHSRGLYFTDDDRVAQTYGSRIIAAFLNLRTPYINITPSRWSHVRLDDGPSLTEVPPVHRHGYVIWPSAVPAPPQGTVNGGTSDGAYTSYRLPYRTSATVDQLATWARASGFDGLILHNMHDQGGPLTDTDAANGRDRIRATTLVAFDPSQIWMLTGAHKPPAAAQPRAPRSVSPSEAHAMTEHSAHAAR